MADQQNITKIIKNLDKQSIFDIKKDYLRLCRKYQRKSFNVCADAGISQENMQNQNKIQKVRFTNKIQQKQFEYLTPISSQSDKSPENSTKNIKTQSKSKHSIKSQQSRQSVISISSNSQSSSAVYEGGSNNESIADQEDLASEEQDEIIEEEDEEANDNEDPYQINRLDEIAHQDLKEMYTQVVDELLDLQLEFEEKITEVEEQAAKNIADAQKEKELSDEKFTALIEQKDAEIEKCKAAIGKLSDRYQKSQELLQKARQNQQVSPNAAQSTVQLAELQKVQEKLELVQEDYKEEKKISAKLEEDFDKYKKKMEKIEESFKENQRQLAKIEIENDELKNDIRQMGFMVEDLEQKLDSQLEINELLNTEQEEMKQHLEEQMERLKQQLDEALSDVAIKDKELRKIRLQQLFIETQALDQINVSNLDRTTRNLTVYKKEKQFDFITPKNNKNVQKNDFGQQFDEKQTDEIDAQNIQNAKIQDQQEIPLDQTVIVEDDKNPEQANQKSPASSDAPDPPAQTQSQEKMLENQRNIELNDVVIEEIRDDDMQENLRNNSQQQNQRSKPINLAENKFASFAGNGAIGELGFNLNKQHFQANREDPFDFANMNYGLGDFKMENLDEILECGDDLMEIEQTAFMGSSKIMLQMIDNMLLSIDDKIEVISKNQQFKQPSYQYTM